MTWPQIISLFEFWKEFPPVHVMVQAIASGMAGHPVGEPSSNNKKQRTSTPNKIESVEDFMGLVSTMTTGPNAVVDPSVIGVPRG